MARPANAVVQKLAYLGVMNAREADIVIVGGGPVGIYLGCLLIQNGISCYIVEQRVTPSNHTRSIGIHPPGLECLAEVGIADELISEGVSVSEGVAYTNNRILGTLSFTSCPPPYQFVLALPQYRTEQILEKRLNELDPSALIRGARVTVIEERSDGVSVTTVMEDETQDEAETRVFNASFVVGCDGKSSLVRQAARIDFPGKEYADTFLMGDFKDNTNLGDRAGIFLTEQGVVESFPLPAGVRRWVVKTDHLLEAGSPEILAGIVADRTEHRPDTTTCSMISPFTVSNYLAKRMAYGRVLLAGDAAHIVSPIGGQGMNLGWLDARCLHPILERAIGTEKGYESMFRAYSKSRRRAARIARRRSEFNMWMGRGGRHETMKHNGVQWILHSPLSRYFAQRFSMRGL